jgi:hypothetical protein
MQHWVRQIKLYLIRLEPRHFSLLLTTLFLAVSALGPMIPLTTSPGMGGGPGG